MSALPRAASGRTLSPVLEGFLATWQPRQRRTAGMQAVLFNRIYTLARAHLEWADYDLLTHVLAVLHLDHRDRPLTGGRTREQIVDKLVALIAFEHPHDPAERHREIAESAVDLLANPVTATRTCGTATCGSGRTAVSAIPLEVLKPHEPHAMVPFSPSPLIGISATTRIELMTRSIALSAISLRSPAVSSSEWRKFCPQIYP
jgi:hypothetical protein